MDKKLSSVHDLSRGEKAYLKGHGIRAEHFDKMTPTAQAEWKNEVKDNHYAKMYDKKLARSSKSYFGGVPSK